MTNKKIVALYKGEEFIDAGKPIHSLRELAKQIDSGYKRIEIMVDQKLKEAGIE